ncbi:hypothetical protein GQR58_016707 [Nymphon striatum]|nr:hypothetical protein GQR58_016707 [Nymphon striatum]
MAFNVPKDIKASPSLISIGEVDLKNVRTFKYLGHMITNNKEDPSFYLTFRISSAFQKKIINNGFKRKNVPIEYLAARKPERKKSSTTVPEPDDLDWAYVFNNEKLRLITNTCYITNFCKIQHLKYVAHVTRLDDSSFQKQLLFSCEHRKYYRDRWIKIEKELNISKMQIQKMMQNKNEFMSLLYSAKHCGFRVKARMSQLVVKHKMGGLTLHEGQQQRKETQNYEVAYASCVSGVNESSEVKWIGHILRKESKDAKIAWKWTPPGRRNTGRPRTTWRRMVEKERKDLGFTTWEKARTPANQREKWQDFEPQDAQKRTEIPVGGQENLAHNTHFLKSAVHIEQIIKRIREEIFIINLGF